ncbi:MAG: class II fructose-bisphosphate aldolase [Oscillospiraceae bacterium]|nr:class II fructose-bisphosphate aldolase [Oscillospiraceae bacterium]
MALVTTGAMLDEAYEGGYAVAAFNCENMEMVQAVIEAAAEMRSPVIVQTTPGTLEYATPSMFAAIARGAAKDHGFPVAMHLDHGKDRDMAVRALAAGYTSVMVDGSALPLADNMAVTREVAEVCGAAGIPVEGELGRIGGKEDGEVGGDGYTDPDEAAAFVKGTGVTSLAIGIGTSHGVYAREPVLKISLVPRIREKVRIPMVLHGASGLSEADIKACIAGGIAKVNFATELRIAYTKAVRKFLAGDAKCIDPKKFGKAARKAVREVAAEKMAICGCAGRC